MRTGLRILLIAAICGSVALPSSPAGAASRRRVLACRSSNPTCWPVAFAHTPGGNLFYVERYTGEIRVRNAKTGRDRAWHRVPGIATSGEQGLLGIALDPRWRRAKRFRYVYVYYTNRSPLENRIARFRRRDGRIRGRVLTRIPASVNHNGGTIGFGRGGKLFAVTGDAGNRSNSQSFSNLAGKVLRMTKRGEVPTDNPILGGRRTRIWSYGHRNSFGFAFDPFTRRIWQTENGPQCNDEINLILAAHNYGWGPTADSDCGGTPEAEETNRDGPSPRFPAFLINPVIAPTGATFCDGCGVPGEQGRLLYGNVNDGSIRSIALTGGRTGISAGSDRLVLSNGALVLGMRTRRGGIYFSDPSGVYRLV
ncbi:MAG TPA: PQQ-dependent sugar dehydrogenase [Actinomycetota bacterium]|nr:PQQ-dependent sugar dehydrogenase [Actinomycetota bacterium]